MEQLYRTAFRRVTAPKRLKETVEGIPSRPRRRHVPLAAAVCAAVLLTVTTAVALRMYHVEVETLYAEKEESGYTVVFRAERAALADFSPEVREAAARMRETGEAAADVYRDTWQETTAWLGLDLPNPLEEQPWLEADSFNAWGGAGTLTNEERGSHCSICLETGRERELIRTHARAGYRSQGVWLLLDAVVDTEAMEESRWGASLSWEEGITVEETATGSGAKAILLSAPTLGVTDAYFIYEGTAYHLQARQNFWEQYLEGSPRDVLLQALACF